MCLRSDGGELGDHCKVPFNKTFIWKRRYINASLLSSLYHCLCHYHPGGGLPYLTGRNV